jgi:hypothetical protein
VGNERVVGSWTVEVDKPGKELFANAALPLDEDAGIPALCALDGENLGIEKFRVLSQQSADALKPHDFLAKPVDFVAKPCMLQGILNRDLELVDVDRLDQVVECAALHGHNDIFHLLESRDHDNSGRRAKFFQPKEDVQPARVGKADVEQDEVGTFLFGKLQATGAVFGFNDGTRLFKKSPECRSEWVLVVHEQNNLLLAHERNPLVVLK